MKVRDSGVLDADLDGTQPGISEPREMGCARIVLTDAKPIGEAKRRFERGAYLFEGQVAAPRLVWERQRRAEGIILTGAA